MGKKARTLGVAFGIPNVVFGVSDVQVATNDDRATIFEVRSNERPPFFHPAFFELLPFLFVRAAGQVRVDAHHAVDLGDEDAPFEVGWIEGSALAGLDDGVRAGGARRHTGIPFLFSRVKRDIPFTGPRPSFGELFFERPGFLKHHHIGVQVLKVRINALSNGCAQAVDVP